MIVMTVIFLGIAYYEWHFLKARQRQKRTYWIVGGWLLVAYGYLFAVYTVEGLPSPNQLIEWMFGPIAHIVRN
ncbi:hypothetical protein P9314_19425 [Paenibacillus validus]|uniref:hypothetical protein n=1 Tax=Paenibacillus validus TaxID=44253 RepID=UPI0013E07FD5|nr:hypothetical protein [Paenibacillus validus]MED4602808.1 hypothetical protein [Paenibacillus validus]MED4607350.1 hypothetical protein [Paenibacillus validus]